MADLESPGSAGLGRFRVASTSGEVRFDPRTPGGWAEGVTTTRLRGLVRDQATGALVIADLASADVARVEGLPTVPDLPDLLLFSDAGAEGGVVSSGGALTRWVDLSGSGGAIDQVGAVPLTGGLIGGRPALRWTVASTAAAIHTPLELATPEYPALTLGIVARLDVIDSNLKYLFDMSPGFHGFGVRVFNQELEVFSRMNSTGAHVWGWYQSGDRVPLPAEALTDRRMLVILNFGHTSVRAWVYGASTMTTRGIDAPNWQYLLGPAGNLVIGNSIEANGPWKGDIGEAWVMAAAISDADREAYAARVRAMWMS